jgi:hypothetical protein
VRVNERRISQWRKIHIVSSPISRLTARHSHEKLSGQIIKMTLVRDNQKLPLREIVR